MTAIVPGNDKGGLGKDMIAEALMLGAQRRGLKATLIELESSTRLGHLYPDTISIPINAPTPEILYGNPDVVYEPIDRAAALWNSEQLSITSLGANVTSAVINWGRSNAASVKAGETLTFVIVLSMGRAALAAGLGNLYDLGIYFPRARRVAVLNDVHAPFLPGDPLIAQRLEEARGTGLPIETIHVPRMAAPVWGYAQNCGSLAEIAQLDPDRLLALGLPEGPVRRSMPMITDWVLNKLVTPLEALLPPAPARKAKGK